MFDKGTYVCAGMKYARMCIGVARAWVVGESEEYKPKVTARPQRARRFLTWLGLAQAFLERVPKACRHTYHCCMRA